MASNCKLLYKRTAIITGCNKGIGKAIAERYAANGADIFACVRKESTAFSESLKQLSDEYSVDIIPIYVDLRNIDEIKSAVKQIKDSKKKIDVLVNNAGIGYNALFQMSGLDKLKEVFDINFIAPFVFTQYVTKLMIGQRSGNIISIASTAGIDVNDGQSVYGASKAALIHMTNVIASELKAFGIRANSIAPGLTDTDMLMCLPKEIYANRTEIAKPSQIADAAVFLASELSAHVSGQVIRVDGGRK